MMCLRAAIFPANTNTAKHFSDPAQGLYRVYYQKVSLIYPQSDAEPANLILGSAPIL